MDSILDVRMLNKSYIGGFSIRDVAFFMPEGCITGFIGVNGAGKTTVIRSILGLSARDSGQIQFFGLDFDKNERQIKDRIGVVLDAESFYEDLSLAEMKDIIAPSYTRWSEAEFREYLDRFELHPKQKIKLLSKGMKVKYSLALALSHKAELLIMDEPTSGLDPLIRSQVLKILTEYMEKGGRGVLFSTHILSDLDKITDMLVMIDNGKIVFQDEKDALLNQYRIVKGDVRQLNEPVRKLILNIEETDYGFTGITRQISELKQFIPDVIVEHAAIEDIMLANIRKGGKK
ncbi:MAG: ABC transporter ATP-binding protein [Lachnospiraceae bacterium]|nr:ABC transporter ATP-binding protein [Lachnospiraceae bacterium]